jgi:drug/metabolite transporter (DMT)-like permease
METRKVKKDKNTEKIENGATMSVLSEKNTNKNGHSSLFFGVFFIVLSAFFFSLMSVFVRYAGELPTFQKALFRNSVAAFVGFIMLIKSRSFKIQKGSFLPLLLRSAAGTVGIVCNFYAIDHMPISDASMFNKLSPFFTVIFSIFIIKERTTLVDWLLVGLAFVGVLFVSRPTLDYAELLPPTIGLLGALGAGLAYAFVRQLRNQGERAEMIVFFFSLFSCVAVIPFVVADHAPMKAAQVGWLLLAGCAASGAQFSLTAAYKYAPAKELSVFDYSQVLFAAVWGMILFSEYPTAWGVLGYAIILIAAILKWWLYKREKRK